MASIQSKHTKPEIMVRSIIHRLGYRFRLHVSTLPGKPDIVLPKLEKIVQVNGCFWHGHNCPRGRLPLSNKSFWSEKISKNMQRDRRNNRDLKGLGWEIFIVWGCQLRSSSGIRKTELSLQKFLTR